jgi:hypothetical protein
MVVKRSRNSKTPSLIRKPLEIVVTCGTFEYRSRHTQLLNACLPLHRMRLSMKQLEARIVIVKYFLFDLLGRSRRVLNAQAFGHVVVTVLGVGRPVTIVTQAFPQRL